MTSPRTFGRSGFTVVEVLVSVAIVSMILAGLFAVFVQARQRMHSLKTQAQMYQNLRFATTLLSRDLRMAGYGLNRPASELHDWITWVSGVTNVATVVSGGTSSDTLLIAAAFDRVCTTSVSAAKGATAISLNSGAGSEFTSSRRLVFIGRCELARVTAVSGDTLSISTLPTTSMGLNYAHAAGTPVEIVDVVRYSVYPASGSNPPFLRRERTTRTSEALTSQLVAEGIEGLKITRNGTRAFDIVLSGRALVRDRYAVGQPDLLHRAAITNTVYLRNER